MKKKNFIASVLVFVFTFTLFACDGKGSGGGGTDPVKPLSYSVWGTNNLTSVIQETDHNDDYDKSSASLEFFMAKGEQEYDQLIITAENPIPSIELVASELRNGDKVISTDQIQVFMQKYTYCTDVTKWRGVMGIKDDTAYFDHYYPDMLMNMDVAKRYGENKVAENNNQGFTVRIKTDEDTVAGEYVGNFTLKVGNEQKIIPVSVMVWDFALGNATGKSLIYTQYPYFMNGEFDNTVEMQRTYYELCLEYDVNPQFFPGYESFIYNKDIDGFVAEIERYWDHPNFTSYCIPNYELSIWGQFTQEGQELVLNTFIAIAKASTEGRNYFDKLTICHPSLDEPQQDKTGAIFSRVGNYFNIINTLGEKAIEQLEKDGYFDGKSAEFTEEMKYSLRHIQQIITATYTDELTLNGQPYDQVNGWCPTIELYATQVDRDFYKAEAERTEGEQWFYTCNQPQYPYASHYTHQSPVAWRALKWIQYDLDIEGYLTWFINYYDKEELRDPYTETQVWDMNPNGDGYFFYPGRAYDSDPFPTQKLLTYSDGQEDMDLLNLFEKLFIKVSADYGISESQAQINFDLMLGNMMDRIIDGATNTFKSEDLLNVRKEIAQMILSLQRGELIFYSFDFTTANYTVYTETSSLTINGAVKSAQSLGSGKYQFTGSVDLTAESSLSVKIGDFTTDLFLSKTKIPVSFTDSDIRTTIGSSVSVQNSKVNFIMQTKTDITFEASIKIKISAFGINKFTEMDNLTFDYTNSSNENYVLSILLVKGSNSMELERYNIPANSTITISLPLVYNNKDGYNYERNIGKTDELKLAILNNSGNVFAGSISKMSFTKEG